MKPAGMLRKEGPAGQRGSLFKGPDAAGRPAGFIPPGEGWRASRCRVTLVARSTRYASARVPRLARPTPFARGRRSSSDTQERYPERWRERPCETLATCDSKVPTPAPGMSGGKIPKRLRLTRPYLDADLRTAAFQVCP